MQYTGARILIETLIEQGVDTVFGYPGGAVLHIYDELYKHRDRIRHILVSHEQHAAHAADGYARSSGKTGVCIATSGPGATNLVTGIATAYVDSVPIVAITGNVSGHLLGKDSFQEVDIAGITMPVVKHNRIVKNVSCLAETIREAFAVARSGRPGPVLIDIPKDVTVDKWECEWGVGSREWGMGIGDRGSGIGEQGAGSKEQRTINSEQRKSLLTTNHSLLPNTNIDDAVALLKNAKRPVFYAGGGVIISGAENELLELAEKLNAPVALSLMGIGAFPRNHRLCTGLIGMHGTEVSNKALRKSDLLVAVGARFSDRVIPQIEKFARNAKILHIDIDPAEINKNIQADAFVTGDLKTVLTCLLEKFSEKPATGWDGEIGKWKAAVPTEKFRKTGLHPGFVIRETAEALGADTIAVTDVGRHQIWAAQFFPFSRPRSFLTSGGMGTMGYGLGAAVGAKIANPGHPVALFTGDGCFRMNCAEMATLVYYKLPVLIVVFNNQTLGMVRQWQDFYCESRYSETGLDGRGPDFVKLAGAYGVPAFRTDCRASFNDALKKSLENLASGTPVLIEVVIDRDEQALPMMPGNAL